MADIDLVYDETNGIIDGKKTDAGQVSANQYNSISSNSLEVINGHLDTENRRRTSPLNPLPGSGLAPALWTVKTVHLQPGSVSRGASIGSTLNLDYFPEANFGTWNWGDATAGGGQGSVVDTASFYQPIPGASVEFYLPHNGAMVLLTWKIAVSCSGDLNSHSAWQDAAMKLFVNGTATGHYHVIPLSDTNYTGGSRTHSTVVYDRVWSGHHLTVGSKGWQTASIRLAIGENDSEVEHVRVRTRSFSYLYFH